jgi:hypothetical protein
MLLMAAVAEDSTPSLARYCTTSSSSCGSRSSSSSSSCCWSSPLLELKKRDALAKMVADTQETAPYYTSTSHATRLLLHKLDGALDGTANRILECVRALQSEFGHTDNEITCYFQNSPLGHVSVLVATVVTLAYIAAVRLLDKPLRWTLTATFCLAVALVALPTMSAEGASTRNQISATLMFVWAIQCGRCIQDYDGETLGLFDWIQCTVLCCLWLLPHALGLTSTAVGNFKLLVAGTLLAVTGLWLGDDGGYNWLIWLGILVLHSPALVEQQPSLSSSSNVTVSTKLWNYRRIFGALLCGACLLVWQSSSSRLTQMPAPVSLLGPSSFTYHSLPDNTSEEAVQELSSRQETLQTKVTWFHDLALTTLMRDDDLSPDLELPKEREACYPSDAHPREPSAVPMDELESFAQQPLAAPTRISRTSTVPDPESAWISSDLAAVSVMPKATTAPEHEESYILTSEDIITVLAADTFEEFLPRDEVVCVAAPVVPEMSIVVPRLLSLSTRWAVRPPIPSEPLVVTTCPRLLVEQHVCALVWLLRGQVLCSDLPLGLALLAFTTTVSEEFAVAAASSTAVHDVANATVLFVSDVVREAALHQCPAQTPDEALSLQQQPSWLPVTETSAQEPAALHDHVDNSNNNNNSVPHHFPKLKITPDLLVGNWA